jgi:hypothetical protein
VKLAEDSRVPERPFATYSDNELTQYLQETAFTFERLQDRTVRVYRIGSSVADAEREDSVRKHIKQLNHRILK